ncbi:hypothetical protein NCCP2222_02790 [Sporosarcina sp. NCCP-2222]|uniref:hypothetical protein n=1 Tax=Sporosarcina sp. NCCP-2222 TaxID=2935073 RepID=UPI0020811B65|nr:hypothetical protein [Sporosarcina sp. NCCP-2222]GKV54332.1 hypothetical protein NCCP2222_02790 [Sporosarcina sp. NCCP-2222]
MESLIPLIIFGLISLFLKGKKPEGADAKPEKQESNKVKPFTAQKQGSDPFKKLKEMSQEMYQELQREFQNPPDEPPSRQTTVESPQTRMETRRPAAQPAAVQPKPTAKPAQPAAFSARKETPKREERTGRLSAHGGRKAQELTVMEPEHMIPKNEQDLLKGIIFSEILGPPKAKR